ncbi:hypothetical protein ACJIZ3_024500 [Penstemon smallii]|uniref:Tetrahydrofolate dehydrogenase/cyclohydrolase NAD(P)-binding domain-containing protein n=1 Tax=Penstemon smallii TaxID=265156 RepID=A0ABD3TS06_9LAMI
MIKRMVPIVAALWPIWLRKSFVNPSTSRSFSNQIIKSPSLLSLDLADSWFSSSKHSDHSSIQECPRKWTSKIIDGKAIAEGIRSRITSEVSQMKELTGQVPGLAVILVGQRRDSQTYVRKKLAASEEVGIRFKLAAFPENCTECEVCNALCKFNEDPSIHGILVQLPLPQSGVEISGKRAVVIGKSNIVGLPLSLLLQRHHATVSIVHAFTKNPEEITREADILVTAAGVPNLIRDSWLKPGAIVIDVGTTPVEDPSSEHGYRLIGDVCFKEATRVASAITPVPGGVGPMTVTMLLYNTLESAKRAFKLTK